MFFDSWHALIRVAVVGALSYLTLIAVLRISGKRTLAKWNAFDFVVTVAIGSTLATVLLSKQVALLEGMLALCLLITLQFAISWLSIRSRAVRRLIKSEPAFLYRDGAFMHERLRAERVTESEVRAAVREAGVASLGEIEAVVLETDGSVSVIRRSARGDASALSDVT
jgi:uncharacterized membrane protein YcaP (DUF421 family)